MIAASHWEVLGWGGRAGVQSAVGEGTGASTADSWGDEVGDGGEESAREGRWAVTYFAKTLFTPAGIDVYSRDPGGLGDEKVEQIKEALVKSEDEAVKKLADSLFEVEIG